MSDVLERRGPSTGIADGLRTQWGAEMKAINDRKAQMTQLANTMYKDIGDNYYHLQEPMGKFSFLPETIARSGTFSRKTRDLFASGADQAEVLDTLAHELFHAKYAEKGHPDYQEYKSVGHPVVNRYHRDPPEVWREAYAQHLPSIGPPDTVRWSNEELLADVAANEYIKNNFPETKAPYAEQVAEVLKKDSGGDLGIGYGYADQQPATTPGILQEIELIKSKHLPSVHQPPLWYTISSILKGHGL